MFKLFLPSLLALLFFVNARSQEKLIYETGATLVDKARILLEQEEYDEAIKVYQKISPNDSLYTNAFVTRSYYQLLQGNFNESLEVIEEGLKVADPASRRGLLVNKGVCYDGLEEYDRAKEVYKQALKEYPRSHKLRYNLSRMNYKLEEKEETYHNLILTLEANPFYEKTLLQLGNMYREQNKRAEALLLYNLYLLFSPDGKNSLAVLQTANDMVGEIKNLDGNTYAITKDDALFETHNLLIESQLALKKDFEISNGLNIPFSKQTFALLKQLQKESFKGESRLWSELIIPYFEWINENNHFGNLSYTTGYSIENAEIKKVIVKKIDDIKEFLPKAYSKWTELSAKESVAANGKESSIKRDYLDGLLTAEGEVNDQGKQIGAWVFYNDSGQVIAKGKFIDGKRDGNWEWYHENGVLKEKGQYVQGLEEGKYEFFHDNGNRSLTVNFKAGKLEGPYDLYALTGALQERRMYKEGEIEGIRRFFYECDENLLYYEYTLKDGKAHGPYKELYPNGKLLKTMTIVNDYAEGKENLYHYNGQLAATTNYSKGNYTGPFTTYYNTGEKESTGFYEDGEYTGVRNVYFPDGSLREKYQYQGGKLEGSYLVYDRDGAVLSDFNYKNGLLREYTFFDKNGKVMESQKKKSGELYYKGYDPARSLLAQGLYDIKGGKKGDWKFYYTSGVLKEEGSYKENRVDGPNTLYYPNGAKQDRSNYKEGVLVDYEVTYYPFGQIQSQAYYKEGLRDGRMYTYHPNGQINVENYYHKGKLNGTQKYFDYNGKPTGETFYKFGVVMSETIFKSDGTILEKIDKFSNQGETLTYHYENGEIETSSAYKYGIYHGPHKEYDFYGNISAEAMYVNNNFDGPVISYYAGGGIKQKQLYVNGILNGPNIQYYKNGKVQDSTFYKNGVEEGFSEYFNENGVKTGALFYVDGSLHGARKFYGEEKGQLQLIRFYDYGKLIGYSYLDTTGKEVPMIDLPEGTGKVVSYFSNGTKGREMTYEQGLNQGEYNAYYENGQIERKHNYLDNNIHGKALKYYPDGTLKSETVYFHGYKQGVEKLFYKNGNLKEESTYRSSEPDGERHYYNEQGEKTKTEVYFNGKIIKSQSF